MLPTVIIGAQWGDEGKGKIVDLLAKNSDIVVRFNGGNNAGHTVVVKSERFPLSLLPSGVLQKKKLFISQGVVIAPDVLLSEIDFFKKRGVEVDLLIDRRSNIIMPYHRWLDAATEASKGDKKVGSLKLGIGYCYEDRNNRHGIRFEDLINPKILKVKLEIEFELVKKRLESVYNFKVDLKLGQIYKEYKTYGLKLKKYIGDVSWEVYKSLGLRKIIFEGAHGTFLDGNFGTYPYTTAVNTISGSVFSYVGFPPQKLNVLGIVKAYTTRVGSGPFPAELNDDTGTFLQERGKEIGTVSKRKRRCGWLDMVMLKYANRLNGFDCLALTKLDVLTGLPFIKIVTSYQCGGKLTEDFPSSLTELEKCKPIFKSLPGWHDTISGIKRYQNLPKNCRLYIETIEKLLKVPVKYISVGAERSEIIIK
ncbi:adenylosuccinate synthase [Candidatus Gottesmanbacteria bacterium RIFCSPLOWO2_01_FULL_39_12b]|uniref:Adenylosuccinate synthetase n=1 Tax=Candidatus Gottesmanbacteria bacterium RIFCSPLOWO2_01_FULL_39_12b TaxID=1798388 RepID=A0A1F6AQ93_9BACT|nr:MAG: adenylosuccinate synthase [Candidatus Gottesmanbacteria bacterium RIFCSPLOWO2_01_FULL_39_12b]